MSSVRIELVQTRGGRWHIEVFVNDEGPLGDGKSYPSREAAQAACEDLLERLCEEFAT